MSSSSEPVYDVFSNQLILREISESLRAKDLTNLRQTCTSFNFSLIPVIRKKLDPIQLCLTADPKTDGGDFCGRLEKFRKIVTRELLPEFVQLMKASSRIPVCKYRVISRQNLSAYTERYGNSIRSLSIQWDAHSHEKDKWTLDAVHEIVFENTGTDAAGMDIESWFMGHLETTLKATAEVNPEQVITFVQGDLPNLKSLRLIYSDDERVISMLIAAASELIAAATAGLEVLQLPAPNYDEYDGYYNQFAASVLTRLRDSSASAISIQTLNRLEIGEVSKTSLEILTQLCPRTSARLQLKTFSADVAIRSDSVDGGGHKEAPDEERKEVAQMLKRFLQTQAGSLRELKLQLTFGQYPEQSGRRVWILLPQLRQLETLEVHNGVGVSGLVEVDIEFQHDGKSFADSFPKLKRFRFSLNYNHGLHGLLIQNRALSHSGMTELSVHEAIMYDLEVLVSLFPSVKRLEVQIDFHIYDAIDSLARIWTTWTGLTHLNLNMESVYGMRPDELLTGIPVAQTSEVKAELDTLTKSSKSQATLEELAALTNNYKTRAGVGDLGQLERLEFCWAEDGSWEGSKLTDIGICCGLALARPRLCHIRLQGENVITKECDNFLRNVLGPSAVINIK